MLASSTRGVQILGLLFAIGTAYGLYNYSLGMQELGLILAGYFAYGCLGIVVTFHRYLTHHSYKTYSIIPKIFSIFGCLAGTGSALAWVAIHINHHKHSDTEKDPHSPRYNGISIFKLDYEQYIDKKTKWRMRGIITDRYQQFLHRYYFAVMAAWSGLLFLLGGVYLMLFLHWIPALVTMLMSNVVNFIGHKPNWLGGYRRFDLKDDSANNWLWAIPSWGESWHNAHHKYPGRSTFAIKWYELDIAGLIIKAISK